MNRPMRPPSRSVQRGGGRGRQAKRPGAPHGGPCLRMAWHVPVHLGPADCGSPPHPSSWGPGRGLAGCGSGVGVVLWRVTARGSPHPNPIPGAPWSASIRRQSFGQSRPMHPPSRSVQRGGGKRARDRGPGPVPRPSCQCSCGPGLRLRGAPFVAGGVPGGRGGCGDLGLGLGTAQGTAPGWTVGGAAADGWRQPG